MWGCAGVDRQPSKCSGVIRSWLILGAGRQVKMGAVEGSGISIELFELFEVRVKCRDAKIFSVEEHARGMQSKIWKAGSAGMRTLEFGKNRNAGTQKQNIGTLARGTQRHKGTRAHLCNHIVTYNHKKGLHMS